MFSRLLGLYPYGHIDLPETPVEHNPPVIADGATGIVDMARGAEIRFAPKVSFLKGGNRFTADGKGSQVIVGTGSSFEGSTVQVNGNDCTVIIGERCRIRGLKIIVRRPNSVVVIGAGTTWESGAIISESGNIVAIGNDCMMSNGVLLRTSDGHSIFDKATRQAINAPADVFIGNHVWLGNSSRVNKGTSIGSGSIIGQGAIASGKLCHNAIYAGVPATIKRSNIVWSRTNNYEDIPPEYTI